MSFAAGHIENQDNIKTPSISANQLTSKEIEVLLSLIKKTSFLGEDIEPLYHMITKLQNQYIEQNNIKL